MTIVLVDSDDESNTAHVNMLIRKQRSRKPSDACKRAAESAQLCAQLLGEDSSDEEDKPLRSKESKRRKRSHAPQRTVHSTSRIPATSNPGSSSHNVDVFGMLSTLQDQFLAQQSNLAELTSTRVKLSAAQASEQAARAAESAARKAKDEAQLLLETHRAESAARKAEILHLTDALLAAQSEVAQAKAPTTVTATAASSGLKSVQAAYDDIINEVKKQYNSQMAKFAKQPAPSPPPPRSPAPSARYAQIRQFNTNPQYPTTREVKFWAAPDIAALPTALSANATSPLQQSMFPYPGFYFEDGTAGSHNWHHIQDVTVTTQLLALGTTQGLTLGTNNAISRNTSFTPTVGKTCQYTVGQHTYSLTVAMATPPPPPPSPAPPLWQSKLLFEKPTPVHFKTGFLAELLDNHAWGGDDSQIVSRNIASLAELFSSLGHGFKYDVNKCFLWCKPDWFKIWLRVAISRGYTSCRIGMHGSGAYDELGMDIAGYNMKYARCGFKNYALYVAASDDIASDYNDTAKFKPGSCMIGLLLTKKDAPLGAYEQYHLASRSGKTEKCLNAIAVRDQLLWLPLGMAVAL